MPSIVAHDIKLVLYDPEVSTYACSQCVVYRKGNTSTST